MRQTMHDRGWKDIMVGYGKVNQWRIYNLRTRKVHISASVRFDKRFSYYDTSYGVTDDDTNEDKKMGDI